MSFTAFFRKSDRKIYYAFANEEHRLPSHSSMDEFIKLPPNPTVVLATATYMTEDAQLDSLKSIYELDRQLNLEAEDEREMIFYQYARINY